MTDSELHQSEPRSYTELLQQNQALRQEIEALRAQEARIWSLFAETSRKTQIYSASIKAAVSSLLNYDIFWDHATHHEFLTPIDSSVNQVSDMIALLTLAFRAQANSLTLNRDPHLLQEILSISQIIIKKKYPDLLLAVSFPSEGKPVLVDYEYLGKALQLLYEVFYSRGLTGEIQAAAQEYDNGWHLDFTGLDAQIVHVIEQMSRCRAQPESAEVLLPENILKLHLVCEILHLHEISVEILDEPDKGPILRLNVPDLTPA